MKKIFFSFSVPAFIFLFASCGGPKAVFKNEWQSGAVNVDGKADEWKLPLRYFDSDTKLNYTISNNNENLYVCIKASDPDQLTKIMQAGMQLWLDTTGKKNKHVGIEYPLSAIERGGDEDKVSTSVKSKDELAMYKKKLAEKCTEMFLTGFKPPLGARTFKKDAGGLSVTINWDATNSLIYEAVIPFKTFYKQTLTPADSLKNFGFCIMVNALPKPKSKTTPTQAPTGMNGQMGAMGGLPSTVTTAKDPIYEKNIFWIKFQPAVKP